MFFEPLPFIISYVCALAKDLQRQSPTYPMFNTPQKTVLQINDLRCFSFCSYRFILNCISNYQFFSAAGHSINAQHLVNLHQQRLCFCAFTYMNHATITGAHI